MTESVKYDSDKIQFIDILLTIGLLIIFVPYIYYRVGGLPSILIIMFWLFVTWGKEYKLIMYNRIARKTLYWILIWAIIVIYNQYAYEGSGTNSYVIISIQTVIWSYLFWFIAQYYVLTNCINRYKYITLASLSILLISSAIQLSALLTNPMYARLITSKDAASPSEMSQIADAYSLGVGNFDNIYGYILLSVPMIFVYLNSKAPIRYLFLIVGILLGITSLRASYMIGTLTIIIAFLIVVAFKQKILKPYYFIIASIIIIYANQNVIGNILLDCLAAINSVGGQNTMSVNKVESIRSIVQDSVYGGTTRFDQYAESLNEFINNPILGGNNCGGHSALLDSLARFGLLGTIPWLLIIFYFNKQMNQLMYMQNQEKKVLSIIFLIPWIFTFILNPTNSRTIYAAYFMIVPGLSLFIKENEK